MAKHRRPSIHEVRTKQIDFGTPVQSEGSMLDTESLTSTLPPATASAMMSRSADAVDAYIRAKDGNRPHLMKSVFTEASVLQIRVRSETTSFQSEVVGRTAIVDTLVRRFNQAWENIYTLCIGTRPTGDLEEFSCDWLVVMSSKNDGSLRIGCGRYEWIFDVGSSRARSLVIVVTAMKAVTSEAAPLMDWVSALPHPWCARAEIIATAPPIPQFQAILRHLKIVEP